MKTVRVWTVMRRDDNCIVHVREPIFNRYRNEWTAAGSFYLTFRQEASLLEQMRTAGVGDWIPERDECVELLISVHDDGVFHLGWVCDEAEDVFGFGLESRFDAEYVCAWLPE